MFAKAIWEQQPPFLSVRIAESENTVSDSERPPLECRRTKEKIRGESIASPESLLAASVYTTAIRHLGALTQEASFTDLSTALDLANEAWWRLQETRTSHLRRTA